MQWDLLLPKRDDGYLQSGVELLNVSSYFRHLLKLHESLLRRKLEDQKSSRWTWSCRHRSAGPNQISFRRSGGWATKVTNYESITNNGKRISVAEEFPLIRQDCCLREERAVGIQREKKWNDFRGNEAPRTRIRGKKWGSFNWLAERLARKSAYEKWSLFLEIHFLNTKHVLAGT